MSSRPTSSKRSTAAAIASRVVFAPSSCAPSSCVRSLFTLLFATTFSLTAVTNLDARDDDSVTVISRPSESRELAKSETELAAIDRRGTTSARVSLPLILYSAENLALRETANSVAHSWVDHARRVAARYSIMNLETLPLPSSEVVGDQPRVESGDLRVDSRRVVPPSEPELEGWDAKYGWRRLWSGEDVLDEHCSGFFHRDLVGPIIRPLTPREQGIRRLARKVGYRQTRKVLRTDLQDRHQIDPTFTFDMYRAERDVIWQLGRGPAFSTTKKRTAEFRSDVLGDEQELERVDLIDWGPLRVDDSGSLAIDLKRVFRRTRPDLEIAPPETSETDEPQGESLFSGKIYRIDTDVRFTPHFSELVGGDGRQFFGKVKAGVSVDFFDSLLHRRTFSTEIEAWQKPNGDSAVFMNLVIWGN